MTSTSSNTQRTPSNEILSNLDEKRCLTALEFSVTLLCSQSILAMKDANLSIREKQLIKRELSTELAVFHEFVRKRIMTDAKGPLYRKKRGVEIIGTQSPFEAMRTSAIPAQDRMVTRHRPTMREKVIRQQHQSAAAAMTPHMASTASLKRPPIDLSPIVASEHAAASTIRKTTTPTSSTPFQPTERIVLKPVYRGSASANSSMDTVDRNESDTDAINSEADVCAYNGLSMVQMVEADYLHLMSIIFLHICQHE